MGIASKKRMSLLLVLGLLLTLTATACANDKNKPSDETTQSGENTTVAEEKPTALSTVPVQDFEGYEFKIISTNQDNRQVDVVAEEENGATLNDLVYRRNKTVEEKFNIKIVASDSPYDQINSLVQKSAMAGDNPYDLYMTNATAHSLASGGHLMPINDMPVVDLTKEWWDQDQVKGMSVKGNLYMVTGDISPTGLLTSECILFNKKLFDKAGLEYPYQTALDGKWTWDSMNKLAANLTTDLNGDGKFTSKDDLFSFTGWFDCAQAFFYGAGGMTTTKNAEDIPELSWNIEQYTNIYNKISELIVGNSGNYELTDHEGSFKVFHDGRAYFCDITFQKIEMFLRDMEDDYGVLPLPKYDENQERYQTCVSGAGTMLVVPISMDNLELHGTIMEAMAAASYDLITPSLFDVIVSTKNVRDDESAEMVQMIIRNRVFDPGYMYGVPGAEFAYDLLKTKSTDVASWFAKKEVGAQKALKKIVDAYENIGK